MIKIEKAIWDSLLDADLNIRYWGYLSRRYYCINRFIKIFLAIIASGTVASWESSSRGGTMTGGRSKELCLSALKKF